jgi:hypothetical protein
MTTNESFRDELYLVFQSHTDCDNRHGHGLCGLCRGYCHEAMKLADIATDVAKRHFPSDSDRGKADG